MALCKENKMDADGFEDLLRTKGKDCEFIDKFDPTLFKGDENRIKKIFNIILHCYKNGYPKGNALHDPIEMIMGYHEVFCQQLNNEIELLNILKIQFFYFFSKFFINCKKVSIFFVN